MEIQELMEFMKQQSAEMKQRSAETDRKFAQLREEFLAVKLVQTEERGSVSPIFQDRRREEAFFEEPNFRHQVKKAAEEKVSVSYFK
jgi:hypothetical protein